MKDFDDTKTAFTTVFLRMNPWGSKHVEDVKIWKKNESNFRWFM